MNYYNNFMNMNYYNNNYLEILLKLLILLCLIYIIELDVRQTNSNNNVLIKCI